MLDTVGPELQVVNKSEKTISLEAESLVLLTPDQDKEATSDLLPINYDGLAKAVKKGDTNFLGQCLSTGSETTSVWLEVSVGLVGSCLLWVNLVRHRFSLKIGNIEAFLFQKAAVYKCNMAIKPAVVTCVVDIFANFVQRLIVKYRPTMPVIPVVVPY
ncbi:hypothetical protein MKW98_003772 [Papaver atlanticum]|nr:hypothetical protein MKW98_003772 [Papaver atlanticum]